MQIFRGPIEMEIDFRLVFEYLVRIFLLFVVWLDVLLFFAFYYHLF